MRKIAFVASTALTLLAAANSSYGVVADVTGWTGAGNTVGTNNYVIQSQTEVGGALQERVNLAGGAYLAQTNLGGTFTSAQSFSATGKVRFVASDDGATVDPLVSIGFFDKDNPALAAPRFGFSFADSSPTAFRVQVGSGGNVVSSGSYAFQIDVNNADSGAGNVRARFFNLVTNAVVANQVAAASPTLVANSFGIVQNPFGADAPRTFQVYLYDLNYPGATLVPEPASLSLLGLGGLALLRRRR